jgi:hypothetical protein
LLLINGAQGIGTGWSTFIPSHNVRDVLEHIRAKLAGEKTLPDIRPWVRGFAGDIILNNQGSGYTTVGVANVSCVPLFQYASSHRDVTVFSHLQPPTTSLESNKVYSINIRTPCWEMDQ